MLRLDKDTLTKVLKLGARIQKLIRGQPVDGGPPTGGKKRAVGAVPES
jgi:hypothetical protein